MYQKIVVLLLTLMLTTLLALHSIPLSASTDTLIETPPAFPNPNVTFGLDNLTLQLHDDGHPLNESSPVKLYAVALSQTYRYDWVYVSAMLRPGGGFKEIGLVYHLALTNNATGDFIAIGYLWENWFETTYVYWQNLQLVNADTHAEVHLALETKFSGSKTIRYLDIEMPSLKYTLTKETTFGIQVHGRQWRLFIDNTFVLSLTSNVGAYKDPVYAQVGGISAYVRNYLDNLYRDCWLYLDNSDSSGLGMSIDSIPPPIALPVRWKNARTVSQYPYSIVLYAGTYEEPISWRTLGGLDSPYTMGGAYPCLRR